MPVSTLGAAVHITPIFLRTLLDNYKKKTGRLAGYQYDDAATDDLAFHEGFNIVKSFLELATTDTIESLQSFTNTHIPAPFWGAVAPVRIPLISCNQAADTLIEWFGPEELKSVVGGERWWQVRGLDGVDAEWITQKEYLKPLSDSGLKKRPQAERDILQMDSLLPVMLYVHGGGYFFGSVNTHRYQILRYARKFKGRAFAMNYRKAPQYPWPCALQDVLAAYLYLIRPPDNAIHTAVPPEKIVFAGDSAGGALCLTVLTVLRDMGLPLPSGAVLISPWVDMTHSFPSVMENVHTDIIPPNGFMAKPSTIWPVDPLPPIDRVAPTTTGPPPEPGHADTVKPNERRVSQRIAEVLKCGTAHVQNAVEDAVEGTGKERGSSVPGFIERGSGKQPEGENIVTGSELDAVSRLAPGAALDRAEGPGRAGQMRIEERSASSRSDAPIAQLREELKENWEPKPPKVLMNDPKETPLELHSQIQQYATNEQLTHPLVSPILQGSLGNLCPLYIIAGDGEALRDEVIYIAHRAAHPDKYPAREGVLREGKRQKENAEKFTKPTKVHLQVFDGMCHVLTVFTFTNSAKYAYRSIAQFVRHVTAHSPEHLERNPFPEYHRPPAPIPPGGKRQRRHSRPPLIGGRRSIHRIVEDGESSDSSDDIAMFMENEDIALKEVNAGEVDKTAGEGGSGKDVPNVSMLRERVDIRGLVRAMEPADEIHILRIPPSQIGIIKEAPVRRWLGGQEEWDKKFKHAAERVKKHRRKNEIKASRMVTHARDKGLLFVDETPGLPRRTESETSIGTLSSTGGLIEEDRRWGPLDLAGESVPSSAIANRRDNPESLALLKSSIYYTAPVTHRTIPRVTKADWVRSALDPHDRTAHPPKQSVSEQQQTQNPIHGLSMWDALVSYFMRKSSTKVEHGKQHAVHAAEKARDITPSTTPGTHASSSSSPAS